MIYVFQDTDTGEVLDLEFSASSVPSIGQVIDQAGRKLRRLASRFGIAYAPGENPRDDDQRRVANEMFHTRLYPGHKSGHDWAKEGVPTKACSKWV